MEVLFFDAIAPKNYTLETLEIGSLGGTEASCLRIADALVKRGIGVTIAQRLRTTTEMLGGIKFVPLEHTPDITYDHVVTLRDAKHYSDNKKTYKKARHYLWMHDVVSGQYRDHLLYFLQDQEVKFICVSEWHKTNIIDALKPEMVKGKMRVNRIYGPIADYWVKDATPYDPNKLIFFSSPHKGLDHVLNIFTQLRRQHPEFTLYISNPGYYPDKSGLPEGTINLGSLPHKELVHHVRTAMCMFYPNVTFYETFGLVLAESNAVGTPVIAHPLGAAREVLFHPSELMDCRDHMAVITKVLAWQSGERPIVKKKEEFSITEVIKEWLKVFKN